jgi:hypothetical protein
MQNRKLPATRGARQLKREERHEQTNCEREIEALAGS